jgi:hypothetical protein
VHEAKELTRIAEFAIAIGLPDLLDVAPSGLSLVRTEAGGIRDIELTNDD